MLFTMITYNELYQKSIIDPHQFWQQQADSIHWFSPPQSILSEDENGLSRWYNGGTLNSCYLALDYHIDQGFGEDIALRYDSPVTNTFKSYTYLRLREEVSLFAGALCQLGLTKGDTVVIYMPMIPEAVVAMLACARLGVIHSVVFGGFAAHELALRIDDAQPKFILLASCGIEINKIIPYKPIVDEAIKEAHFKPLGTVVYQREMCISSLLQGFDHDWDSVLSIAQPTDCVVVNAWDPLYILYTSGTTGKPKGIVRDNGGHAVALIASMKYVYGIEPGEVFFAASDIGWVVGHSYIVYAPLFRRCTTILYEGKPIKTPDAGSFWRIIEDYRVTVFFTAPTAIRAIKKEDASGLFLKKHNLSSLKALFLAGERTDINTFNWIKELLNMPIIDHWWQTESGYPMLANFMGLDCLPSIAGSAGKPNFGFDIRILDSTGQELNCNEEGSVVIKYPLPPGCLPSLWGNDLRFKQAYLDAFPGYYFSGDGGYKDDNGYFFITGRIDDVINVAGHRLSTSEMEEIVSNNSYVAECAVVGCYDDLKGQVPVGFVVLKHETTPSKKDIEQQLILSVRDMIGAIACFKKVYFVNRLPKTRSGKTLRKLLRSIYDKTNYTIPSTIEDSSVIDEIRYSIHGI